MYIIIRACLLPKYQCSQNFKKKINELVRHNIDWICGWKQKNVASFFWNFHAGENILKVLLCRKKWIWVFQFVETKSICGKWASKNCKIVGWRWYFIIVFVCVSTNTNFTCLDRYMPSLCTYLLNHKVFLQAWAKDHFKIIFQKKDHFFKLTISKKIIFPDWKFVKKIFFQQNHRFSKMVFFRSKWSFSKASFFKIFTHENAPKMEAINIFWTQIFYKSFQFNEICTFLI